jgi:hypothetical protein
MCLNGRAYWITAHYRRGSVGYEGAILSLLHLQCHTHTCELTTMIRHKVGWLRAANVLFALGTIVLAALLIVIVWNV